MHPVKDLQLAAQPIGDRLIVGDRLECLTSAGATPVSITSSESIRTFALPPAWRAWK
jgi:hypothetical protein